RVGRGGCDAGERQQETKQRYGWWLPKLHFIHAGNRRVRGCPVLVKKRLFTVFTIVHRIGNREWTRMNANSTGQDEVLRALEVARPVRTRQVAQTRSVAAFISVH